MSELKDWLTKMADECDRECRVAGSEVDIQADPFKAQAHTIAARINWALRAHDAEVREQAKREQYEADCEAECDSCGFPERSQGWRIGPAEFTAGEWLHAAIGPDGKAHNVHECAACDIRAAWAKSHPEKGCSE